MLENILLRVTHFVRVKKDYEYKEKGEFQTFLLETNLVNGRIYRRVIDKLILLNTIFFVYFTS